jgi:hypothetical protein
MYQNSQHSHYINYVFKLVRYRVTLYRLRIQTYCVTLYRLRIQTYCVTFTINCKFTNKLKYMFHAVPVCTLKPSIILI